MMLEIRARIVAPVVGLLASTRSFALLAQHARRVTQPVRHAGVVARRIRGGDGELQAGDADPRIAAGGARVAEAGLGGWRGAAGRVSSDAGQSNGQCFDHRLGAGWRLAATAGTTRDRCKTLSNTRNCAQISAAVLGARAANSRLVPGPMALSTAATAGRSAPVAKFRQVFATGCDPWRAMMDQAAGIGVVKAPHSQQNLHRIDRGCYRGRPSVNPCHKGKFVRKPSLAFVAQFGGGGRALAPSVVCCVRPRGPGRPPDDAAPALRYDATARC